MTRDENFLVVSLKLTAEGKAAVTLDSQVVEILSLALCPAGENTAHLPKPFLADNGFPVNRIDRTEACTKLRSLGCDDAQLEGSLRRLFLVASEGLKGPEASYNAIALVGA